jgi:ATP-dependent DNA ligase
LIRIFGKELAAKSKRGSRVGCEGIVSKRLGSPYRSGRIDQWLKIKSLAPGDRRTGTVGDGDA